MICDCCRRDVEYVRGSFWHGDARICLECFVQWYDLDNDQVESCDRVSIGNFVRLRHGLPPFAVGLAMLVLTMTSTAHASRHCLDYAEVAQTEPRRMAMKERDGCWTFDHHPPRSEVPLLMPDILLPGPEPPTLMDSWPNPIEAELRLLEPDREPYCAPGAPIRSVQPMWMDECLRLLQAWLGTTPLRCRRGAEGY
jgi:hypothetical protein